MWEESVVKSWFLHFLQHPYFSPVDKGMDSCAFHFADNRALCAFVISLAKGLVSFSLSSKSQLNLQVRTLLVQVRNVLQNGV